MNFESLRHFEAVANRRSFVHASEDLHLSQPALTRSIQALERELGARLFDRRAHKVQLTGFGSFVLERTRALTASQHQMSRDIEQFMGVESGNLYVGFGPISAELLAGPAVGRFLHEHPRIGLRVVLMATHEMAEALINGRVDVVIGEPFLRKPQPELLQSALKKRRGFLYCRHGHPLLRKNPLKFSDLSEYPFIGFELPPRIARMAPADSAFGRLDPATGNLMPRVECYSVAAVKQIVTASDGIGAATYSMLWRELRDGVLARLPLATPAIETAYSILTLRGRTMTPAAQAFIKIVRAIDAQQLESPARFPTLAAANGAPLPEEPTSASEQARANSRRQPPTRHRRLRIA